MFSVVSFPPWNGFYAAKGKRKTFLAVFFSVKAKNKKNNL